MKLEDTQTEMYQRAKTELLPGEDLLWVSKPNPRHLRFGRTTAGHKTALIGGIVALLVGLQVFGVLFFFVAKSYGVTKTITSRKKNRIATPPTDSRSPA